MSTGEKFGTFLLFLIAAVFIIWIGLSIKESIDQRAAAEGRYCLIANGATVWTMCIDKDAK